MNEDGKGDANNDDDVDSSPWADHRERLDNARTAARSRYRDHLTAALAQHGVTGPSRLADIALDALIMWRYIDSGAPCRCSCHPRLPDSELHDYGFDCPCAWSKDERRQATEQWRNDIEAFWSSPAGQRMVRAEQAADAELDRWLVTQQGVTIRNHGGFAPESWAGDIDGHSFAFRERFGQWDIEIDHRPSGRFVQEVAGTNPDGTATYRAREVDVGELVASGTIDDLGYGTTSVERAQFIVETIRNHLTREACRYHLDPMDTLTAVLGTPARWCPLCGTRITSR
jgi:hypothetical protein